MWFFGLIVVLLIGAVAVVASGRWGAMAPAYDDRPDMTVPARQALTADDLETARFGVGLRGYRMDEVDTLLERVAREVAERDRRIADLERAVSPIIHGPEGAGFTARADYHPTDFDDTGYNKPILVGGNFPTPEQDTVPAQPETASAEAPPAPEVPTTPEPTAPPEDLAVTSTEAPPAPEAPAKPEAQPEPQPEPTAPPADLAAAATEASPAKPEAQAGAQPEPDLYDEKPAQPSAATGTDALTEPHAVTPPEAPPAPATDEVQPEPWFDEPEPASALDGQPHPPVPLPPMLQELVHTPEDEESESWFQAKEPPPEYSEDAAPEADADEDETDAQTRGRHSAAPDVGAVQRPN